MSAAKPDDLNAAYTTIKSMRPDALLVFNNALLVGWDPQISAFALSAESHSPPMRRFLGTTAYRTLIGS